MHNVDFDTETCQYSNIVFTKEGVDHNNWWFVFDGFFTSSPWWPKPGEIYFNDEVQIDFPVLEGTPYASGNSVTPFKVEILGALLQNLIGKEIYEKKLNLMLSLPLTKECFGEHSLFLLKEHCKLFSPYNDKVKELLQKLEQLG